MASQKLFINLKKMSTPLPRRFFSFKSRSHLITILEVSFLSKVFLDSLIPTLNQGAQRTFSNGSLSKGRLQVLIQESWMNQTVFGERNAIQFRKAI